jgi:predicted RNase H-like HicB family nuclease
MKNYQVIFEETPTGYSAYAPSLPGCITTGKSLSETQANMLKAITGHLAVMREFGDAIPLTDSLM